MRKLLQLGLAAGLVLVVMAPIPAFGGGGGHCEPGDLAVRATGSQAQVDMENACFVPTVLHVKKGATVTFRNVDPYKHNISGPQGTFGYELFKNFGGGDELGVTFDQEGVFPYMCYIHPGMAGAIVVGDPSDVPVGEFEVDDDASDLDAGLTGAAAGNDDDGSGTSSTAPLALGLGIALVLLLGAIGSLAIRRKATATS